MTWKNYIFDEDKLLIISDRLKVLSLRDYSLINVDLAHTMEAPFTMEFFVKSRFIAVYSQPITQTFVVEYFTLDIQKGSCSIFDKEKTVCFEKDE